MKNSDIARLLKISPATVSLALNDKPGVSPDTRRRVLELKDRPLSDEDRSRLAALKKKPEPKADKGTIGILIYRDRGDIIAETPLFTSLINSIDENVNLNDYALSMVYLRSSDADEYISKLNELDLTGVIIIATEMSDETAIRFRDGLHTPFVLLDAGFDSCQVDCVLMNNQSGIIQAVRYGIRMGHKKIGFLRSKNYCYNFGQRFMGYRLGLEEAGLPCDEDLIYDIRCSSEDAKEDMAALLKEGRPLPTLFIASNDRLAIGAMDALKEAGYRIPEDISVIGFDDMPLMQYIEPALTTVKIRFDMNARVAVNRLIEKIENETDSSYCLRQMVETELAIRDSVKDLTLNS